MSSTYRGTNFTGMIDVNIPDTSRELERAVKILAGFPGGVEKAARSALNKAVTSGKTIAARQVNKQYYLKTADFSKYTKSTQRVQTEQNGVSVNLSFRGYHVPLIRFNARLQADGRYKVSVKRNSTGDVLKHVFRAQMSSSHIGLFERIYSSRLPIEQKMGPSVPQMMGANEGLADAVGNQIAEKFESNLDHEVTAILNGWRA